MPNLLYNATDRHFETLAAKASVAVSYARTGAGAFTCAIEQAIVGKSELIHNEPGTGFIIELEARDYIIRKADLVDGADAIVEPQVGDLITEEFEDGSTMVFRVLAAGAGEPAWRYADPGRKWRRIHTKANDET